MLAYLTDRSDRKALSRSKRLNVPDIDRDAGPGTWLTCGEKHQAEVNVMDRTVEENATTIFEVVV